MDWTLTQIKSKVRELSGRKNATQLSEDDLLNYINSYYQLTFPQEVTVEELDDWYEFNTVDGTGEQALPDTVLSVQTPVYIDDVRGTLYTDPVEFYVLYPLDNTDENVPTDVLLYERVLTLRPIPDDAYAVQIKSYNIPGAFSDGTDTPLDAKWGPVIAYGTAIEIMGSLGDLDGAKALKSAPLGYDFQINSIVRKQLNQIPLGTRAKPMF